VKYDDASWHYGGDFPQDLPDEAGATHIALFAAWPALHDLAGNIHTVDCQADLECLRRRELTPRNWFISVCDGKLTDQDLNERGNAFAQAYYGIEGELRTEAGSYLSDYDHVFSDAPSFYHVPDG
jgi:hypothetical protein